MKKILVVLMALFVAIPATAGVVTIDFYTNPIAVAVGAPISTEYSVYGVEFRPGFFGDIPTIALDAGWPGVNVLSTASGLSLGAGDFTIHFTSPVTNVSFDSGLWDTESGFATVTYTLDGINNLQNTYYNVLDSTQLYTFSFPDLTDVLIKDIYFNSSDDIGGASITNLSFTTPVPEPGTMILLGSGLAGLAAYRRKRRKN